MMRGLRWFAFGILSGMMLVVAALPAGAQGATQQEIKAAHSEVRKNLVYLFGSGEPLSGNLIGQPDGAQSQATGFFINDQGFFLTAAHFLKPLDDAVNIRLEIEIGDSGNFRRLPASVVSRLPDLDLLLLRASFPFGETPPSGLTIGSTSNISPDNPPEFLTSGFNGNNYVPDNLGLAETTSGEYPVAWTLTGSVEGGQSGSPVYTITPEGVVVVGIIKASVKTNARLTLMVPIEYSMPLIGHFKIDELERQIADLKKTIGDIADGTKPIGERVTSIERDVNQISRFFTWEADYLSDGTLQIHYRKLVASGDQVDKIAVNLVGDLLLKGENGAMMREKTPALVLDREKNNVFSSPQRSADGLEAWFVIPNVAGILDRSLSGFRGVENKARPITQLNLSIVPNVGDKDLNPEQLTLVPDYVFTLVH